MEIGGGVLYTGGNSGGGWLFSKNYQAALWEINQTSKGKREGRVTEAAVGRDRKGECHVVSMVRETIFRTIGKSRK